MIARAQAMRARVPATVSVLLVALLVWPFLPGVPYDLLNTAILACEYLIVAASLVLLIGMVGQISLCQAALVGMGAFVGAIATQRFGVRFPATLLVGVAAGALTASVIGMVALRVRGLYLAVATLIFAYVCDQYLFTQEWLVQSQSGTSIPPEVIGQPGALPSFDLADAHVFYFVALAVATIALFAVANLRESRVGRAFAALRGSEVAAASLGINVTRFKLLGFAVAGGLAGLGGALTLVGSRTVAPDQFNFMHSLYFLAIAVVGGLRSLGGAIASSVLFAVLVGEVFFRSPSLANYLDLISASLLIAVLLFFQGGLGAIPERLRPYWRRLAASVAHLRARRGQVGAAAPTIAAAPAVQLHVETGEAAAPDLAAHREEVARLVPDGGEIAGTPTPDGRREPALLSARGITVRFGGLTAVDDVSLDVGAGEIVGLIGPNGAGKTTLFNSILGLNVPTAGSVHLFGHDVTSSPVHQRAALGVGRTFQILQLFGDATVFENLLIATHLQNHTGLFGGIAVSPGARRAEREAGERVGAVLRLMELEDLADRRVAGLPFGVLRLIEVARTLVTGAKLVCFDEPASGLDSMETERLILWFQLLRQMGITLLVIEHDVDMVVRLCDHIYVLDQGRLIASGTPAQVQRDPAVIASYLGTSAEVA